MAIYTSALDTAISTSASDTAISTSATDTDISTSATDMAIYTSLCYRYNPAKKKGTYVRILVAQTIIIGALFYTLNWYSGY